MKWDGQAYAEDIKYGLNLLLTDEDREKALTMKHTEFTSYFKDKSKDGMECFSRGVGTGSIIMTYNSNGIDFNFQRPLNNLNETNITLSWSMAARHIRAWELERKEAAYTEEIHKAFGISHVSEDDDKPSETPTNRLQQQWDETHLCGDYYGKVPFCLCSNVTSLNN